MVYGKSHLATGVEFLLLRAWVFSSFAQLSFAVACDRHQLALTYSMLLCLSH